MKKESGNFSLEEEEKEDKMFGKCCDEVVLRFSFKENGFECLLG